ncbi:MAG: PPC domain-containing DNA-binding protein [Candidatus Nanohaloarchaea archaeon]|nr:PPC domain-containing DNA-binding protein [Candidatus Nanohaloarchaea archaeon]
MDVSEEEAYLVVRLDPGDGVIASLKQLRNDYDIDGAFFTGIGAVDRVKLGHYNVETEEYAEEELTGQFEVSNFTGNIGPDKIHAHITVGDEDYQAYAGHCAAAHVSGTFELIVATTETALSHRPDRTTGLDVFDL